MTTEDITITTQGEFKLFRPHTDEAKEWLEENSEGEWYKGSLMVKEEYALDFERQCSEDGGFIVA